MKSQWCADDVWKRDEWQGYVPRSVILWKCSRDINLSVTENSPPAFISTLWGCQRSRSLSLASLCLIISLALLIALLQCDLNTNPLLIYRLLSDG